MEIDLIDNTFLTSLFAAFDDRLIEDTDENKPKIDFNLLIEQLDFSQMWYYMDGSSTTPPCAETHEAYAIPKKTLPISATQMARFQAKLDHPGINEDEGNNRAVQPLGTDRILYQKGWNWASPVDNAIDGASRNSNL